MDWRIVLPFIVWCPRILGAVENISPLLPQTSLLEKCVSFEEEGELKIIDHLIQATERQLENEKQLKALAMQFRDLQEAFVQGNQTKAHASKMVSTARQIQTIIADNHLEHLFPQEYLDELVFFSSIAGKSRVSRP